MCCDQEARCSTSEECRNNCELQKMIIKMLFIVAFDSADIKCNRLLRRANAKESNVPTAIDNIFVTLTGIDAGSTQHLKFQTILNCLQYMTKLTTFYPSHQVSICFIVVYCKVRLHVS